MNGPNVLASLRSRLPEMIRTLGEIVEQESPSRDKLSLDRLATDLARRLESAGGRVERVANPQGGDHLIARFFEDAVGAGPTLVLGHYDTVWPLGTLDRIPFRVEGTRAFGPGVYDMKASLVEFFFAVETITRPTRPVEFLLTSDEEIGSPTSRLLIEDRARQALEVLVLEPPLADGSLKTARKGVGHFTIEVQGKSAHAGVEPEKGLSAIGELARLILRVHALTDLAAGVSVNVGVIEGGTTSNVVAARAVAKVDVRARTLDQARSIEQTITSLQPEQPEARLTIQGGFNRPPMERLPQVIRLFERARQLGRSIGLELGEGSTGGGSDGNFTAALGVPTLDGLGVHGAGAHADHEQVDLESLPERSALLALLLTHSED